MKSRQLATRGGTLLAVSVLAGAAGVLEGGGHSDAGLAVVGLVGFMVGVPVSLLMLFVAFIRVVKADDE